MKKISIGLIVLFFYWGQLCAENINLSGKWQVALDSTDVGIQEQWFNKSFSNTIHLPGTLCDAGYGNPCTSKPSMDREIFLNLKRKFDYVGVAWYKKEIEIPASWSQKQIYLNLERVIWNSQIWIDGKPVHQQNESLIAPHLFNLSSYLSPGKHTISLRIDNRKKYDISIRDLAHAYTNETQTIWNGVLGEISLIKYNQTCISEFNIYPDVEKKKMTVKIQLTGISPQPAKREIIFQIKDAKGNKLPAKKITSDSNSLSFDYFLPNPQLWDEFNPNLYEAQVQIQVGKETDTQTTTFGFRKLTTKKGLLQINDRRIFLRGTLECCIFPLKGYPPTTQSEWEKVFKAAQDYGLNHLRFHSWCPPKAAFEVADKMGFYLQVELPFWVLTVGKDKPTMDFIASEAQRMISEYGNHPSFCFWSMGNELQSDFTALDNLMMPLKKQDPRHLYTTTTFTFEKGHGHWPETNDDFWVSQWTKKGWVRGQGIFDDQATSFNKDYSTAVDSMPVPIITHEIGQYSVYPNLDEIKKYQGNLIPLNFMAVKDDLTKKGRLNQSKNYLNASGKLALILYKEEIERALKTPGFSGFQLLDLHDFPGQGTALVGLLDAFWESKGLTSPEEFRTFCSPVVPLVRFEKATYTNHETLKVQAEFANFSDQALENAIPVWKLMDSKGKMIANGKLSKQNIAIGNAKSAGEFSVSLSGLSQAEKLTLSLSIENTSFKNSWDIWVYPEKIEENIGNVVYTQSFEEARTALEQGKSVLLNPKKENLKGLDGKFVQVFWSPIHFPNQPGTMGVLCDPQHPALKDFPTESHSNWQWWDLCKSGKTMILDTLNTEIQPIVSMVDNFFKNRNLGLLFEAKVGKGKLVVCSPDLSSNLNTRPSVRQFRYSLIHYMQTENFNPRAHLTFDDIKKNLQLVGKEEGNKKSIYE